MLNHITRLMIIASVCGCTAEKGTGSDSGDATGGAEEEPCYVPEGEYTFAAAFTDEFLTHYGECSWVNEVGAPTPDDGFTVTVAVAAGTACGDLHAVTFGLPTTDSGDCPYNSSGTVSCVDEGSVRADGSEDEIEGSGDLYWEYNSGQSGGSCSPAFTFGGAI